MPSGALQLLICASFTPARCTATPLPSGFICSREVLAVEEGLLYPTLQKMLRKGWVTAEWGISETNRKVRFYRLTPTGRAQLEAELSGYGRVPPAIQNPSAHRLRGCP